MTDGTPALHARATTYKGIRMRSRLEATFAAQLDRLVELRPELFAQDPPWQYEPRCFANADGQYLPDFAYTMASPDGPVRCYIEVKPVVGDESHWRKVTDRMAIIWDSEPDALLVLTEREGLMRHWRGVLTAEGGWWVGDDGDPPTDDGSKALRKVLAWASIEAGREGRSKSEQWHEAATRLLLKVAHDGGFGQAEAHRVIVDGLRRGMGLPWNGAVE